MSNTDNVQEPNPYAPEKRTWYRKTVKTQARNFTKSQRRQAKIALRKARHDNELEIITGAERRTLSFALGVV